MISEIVMPRLGWNMEVGSLSSWRKQDGDAVQEGEILFEVESDKAIQEVEALESGILRIPPNSPPPGKTVPVGTLLAYLLKPGDALPEQTQAARVETPALSGAAPSMAGQKTPGQTGSYPPSRRKHPAISPRALRVAKALGVDWGRLQGSGRTGRIVEKDVREAATGSKAASVPEVAAPMTNIRRLTAERMAASAHTTAPVTLTTEADATELVSLRRQLQADGAGPLPSYTDLLVKIASRALVEHPHLNARFEDETIVQPAAVHIGVAVDTDHGLLAPVVRDVQAKSLIQITRETAALIEKARSGRIRPEDLQGGTFTVTNLGMYEIDAFTPIINLPECAILGCGRIVPKQVVMDAEAGRVAIRHMVFLSLTFDHRLVDGAPAARFLQRVKTLVEKPYLWLVR